MFRLPLFDELAPARTVLLAGAGGGFDVFSGLPLYFALRTAGKRVALANLSFADWGRDPGRRVSDGCVEVTTATKPPSARHGCRSAFANRNRCPCDDGAG